MARRLIYSDEARVAMTAERVLSGHKCRRCESPSLRELGKVLTVHHLDGNRNNQASYNLAALCQRCHLRLQGRNPFFTWLVDFPDWYLSHCEEWFRRFLSIYLIEVRAASRARTQLPTSQGMVTGSG